MEEILEYIMEYIEDVENPAYIYDSEYDEGYRDGKLMALKDIKGYIEEIMQ